MEFSEIALGVEHFSCFYGTRKAQGVLTHITTDETHITRVSAFLCVHAAFNVKEKSPGQRHYQTDVMCFSGDCCCVRLIIETSIVGWCGEGIVGSTKSPFGRVSTPN